MIYVDAGCRYCGHAFRWLCGDPLRCPRCRQLLHPLPITRGQYLTPKPSAPSIDEASADGDGAIKQPQRQELAPLKQSLA